jgi:hypothetical protein
MVSTPADVTATGDTAQPIGAQFPSHLHIASRRRRQQLSLLQPDHHQVPPADPNEMPSRPRRSGVSRDSGSCCGSVRCRAASPWPHHVPSVGRRPGPPRRRSTAADDEQDDDRECEREHARPPFRVMVRALLSDSPHLQQPPGHCGAAKLAGAAGASSNVPRGGWPTGLRLPHLRHPCGAAGELSGHALCQVTSPSPGRLWAVRGWPTTASNGRRRPPCEATAAGHRNRSATLVEPCLSPENSLS